MQFDVEVEIHNTICPLQHCTSSSSPSKWDVRIQISLSTVFFPTSSTSWLYVFLFYVYFFSTNDYLQLDYVYRMKITMTTNGHPPHNPTTMAPTPNGRHQHQGAKEAQRRRSGWIQGQGFKTWLCLELQVCFFLLSSYYIY